MDTMTRPPQTGPGSAPPGVPLWSAILLIVAVVAGALLITRDSANQEVSTNTAVNAPAPAAPVVPTLPAPTAEPDWLAVVQSILTFDTWLKLNPAPTRLAEYMDPSHPDYAEGLAKLEQLARGEIRWTSPPPTMTASSVTLRVRDASRATVLVQLGPRRGGEYVDAAGRTTKLTDTAGGPVVWRLVLSPEGRWRLAGVQAP